MLRIFSVMLLSASLASCMSSGNTVLKGQTKASIDQQLSKGDTKAEVTSTFGDPTEVSYTDGGNEIWKYEYIDAASKAQNFIPIVNLFNSGMEGKKYNLVVFFNTKDKVQRYSYTSSDYEVNHGILGK